MMDFAVVIGIQSYPGLSDLQGPCGDANRFADWLKRPDGGDVPAANVHVLLSSQFPAPNGVNDAHPILNEVANLFQPFVDAGINDDPLGNRLFIFMAGHGFSDPQSVDESALYTANATQVMPWHVAATAYAEWFRRHWVFREIALIMDCCRTTSPLHKIRAPMVAELQGSAQANTVKTFYAYATGWGQASRERDINGQSQGIFTTALLEALDHATPDSDGCITGQKIKDYIHNVIDRVAGDIRIEAPDIKVDSAKEFVFTKRPQSLGLKIVIELDPFVGAEEVMVTDGRNAEISRFVAQDSHTEILLKAGLYKVVVTGNQRSKLIEVPNDRHAKL